MGQLYHIISKEDLERVEELLRLMVVDVKWRTAVNDTILSKKFSTRKNTFTILSLKKALLETVFCHYKFRPRINTGNFDQETPGSCFRISYSPGLSSTWILSISKSSRDKIK